jgi:hypothetical protein
MNRFVIGGILAAIVLLMMGGINRLFADRQPGTARLDRTTAPTTETGDLGSLPVEQAGQLVRRQSDLANGGAAATSDTVFNNQDLGQTSGGMSPGDRAIIAPNTTGTAGANNNVIPRTGQPATSPAFGGDIAPIQPNLVQPGAGQRPDDADLDSIPALW